MAKRSKNRELAQKVARLIHKLPLFPHDIDRLLVTAVKPSQDTKEIVRLIGSNPDLQTELLKLVHSYYGTSENIETVDAAARHIGVQPLVQLIGLSYARNAIEEEFASLKYLNEYIEHSEDIFIGCRILAEMSGTPRHQREMYTLAGLIHDIGRLAIMVARNKTTAHVLGTLWDRMTVVVREEKGILGMNHCEVGKQICRKWNFSPVIQEGVLRHHNPLINHDFSFPGALIFISHFLSASDPSGEILSTLSAAEVVTKLNLTVADFDKAKSIYKSRTQNRT